MTKKTPQPLFVFFGTPVFSVRALDALEAQGLLPALVVTAPDKMRGRGLASSPSPVKEWALARGIEVMQPVTLKDPQFVAELSNTEWDMFVVAAYAKLIPQTVLDIPRRGCLNVHPSLLPKFRGPSPVLSAILADERTTGVSIMQMTERMDAGPVVAQARIELEEAEWPPKGSEFTELLFTEGGNLLAEILPEWLNGELEGMPQDEAAATFSRKFIDEDACVDVAGDARAALLKIRAFDQNPRAHFFAQTKSGERIRVIITDAQLRDGTLEILRVIPEGRREMAYADFLNSGATPIV